MLQRAASNACSWWWASHIRTKQSKWLDQSLQDMEEKVKNILNLIEGDGDSFAKRAEMYYKRRPELITAVEESYRVFKALADRYDLLSKDLQNANHTIATVCPDQAHFHIEDNDVCGPPPSKPQNPPNPPSAIPKAPVDNLKGLITEPDKQSPVKKTLVIEDGDKEECKKVVAKSGLSKEVAMKEIDNVHKEILALQTVKEFIKSSYESGLAKYWEIENQISEMQARVTALQDEFDMEVVIADDEARTLMAEAALKSCEQTLSTLRERQENFARESKEGFEKIESGHELINLLKHECLKDQTEELQSLNMADQLRSPESMTATQLADNVDELVNKVIGLETSMTSHTVMINTMRTGVGDLHEQIQRMMEGEKEMTVGDKEKLKLRVHELEAKLSRIQDVHKKVESENCSHGTDFDQARSSLNHLFEKLNRVKLDEEVGGDNSLHSDGSISETTVDEVEVMKEAEASKPKEDEVKTPVKKLVTFSDDRPIVHVIEDDGTDDRERIVLQKYTDILKNYKEVRKKLRDSETQQMKELKEAIVEKDREIQSLQKKLHLLQGNTDVKEVGSDTSVDQSVVKPEECNINILDKDREAETKLTERSNAVTIDEEKLRTEIDTILDNNMDFWLRFSTAYHEVQKFRSEIQDLQDEILKLKEKKQEGVTLAQLTSEARPHYKHLREIQTELTMWLEQSASLRNELQCRFTSLGNMQDEVCKGIDDNIIRSGSCQGAKLQGEILSMKQENNKVRGELQTSVDHVYQLEEEIEKALKQLKDEFGVSSDRPQLQQSFSKARIPLRSFLFGTKPKKNKNSLFSFIHNHRKVHAVKHESNVRY